MRRVSLLLSLFFLGCSSTAPNELPSLQFESQVQPGIPTLPPSAVGGEGTIMITGVIHTESTGFTLRGKVTVSGPNALLLEVDAEDNAPGLPFPVQNLYRAKVGLLAPGDYDLSINHNIHDPAPGSRLRVFHQTVHVN
jgi:hypothetical protein